MGRLGELLIGRLGLRNFGSATPQEVSSVVRLDHLCNPSLFAYAFNKATASRPTPKEVIERINGELNRALRDPDLIAKFAQQGLSPAGGTPVDFQRTIATDLKNWTETAHAARITAQ